MIAAANWSFPTAVKFGPGRVAELAGHAAAIGMRRPLLVTDPGLAALPMTQRLRQRLSAARLEVAVFAEVRPNPTEQCLEAGLAAYREQGCDGVIAFGGGSSLDLGKLVAFMSGQRRPVWDFEDVDDWWTRADPAGIAPVIAVPATAGTGSEVGRAGVLTDTAARVKRVIFHPGMMPKVVICDPEVTVSMPPPITAGAGLDAFAHCLEAYCARGFHPIADGIALEGMRLAVTYLPRAYAAPADMEARGAMMAAALMGAAAFQKGLGAIHALSHPIGALHDTHHGMTNAVVMPAVLEANRSAIEERIERLAAYLGVAGGFDGFLREVRRLRADVGAPQTLTQFGVPRADFEAIRDMALADPTAAGNPIPLTRDLAGRMLEAAFDG